MDSFLLHRQQFLPEFQHLLPAVVGFYVHDNQIPLAILGEEHRLFGLSAQFGNFIVVLADKKE